MQQNLINSETETSEISGLLYIPNFISKELEKELIEKIDLRIWSNELKRRVQHYGYKYNYYKKKITKSDYLGPLPNIFEPVITELFTQDIINKLPDQVIVNEYLPGQGIGAHVDCVSCFEDNIISLSLGSDCEMEFVNLESKEYVVKLLERRSLISLRGLARYSTTHSIKPKYTDNGIKRTRRVSLTFRNVI